MPTPNAAEAATNEDIARFEKKFDALSDMTDRINPADANLHIAVTDIQTQIRNTDGEFDQLLANLDKFTTFILAETQERTSGEAAHSRRSQRVECLLDMSFDVDANNWRLTIATIFSRRRVR